MCFDLGVRFVSGVLCVVCIRCDLLCGVVCVCLCGCLRLCVCGVVCLCALCSAI